MRPRSLLSFISLFILPQNFRWKFPAENKIGRGTISDPLMMTMHSYNAYNDVDIDDNDYDDDGDDNNDDDDDNDDGDNNDDDDNDDDDNSDEDDNVAVA